MQGRKRRSTPCQSEGFGHTIPTNRKKLEEGKTAEDKGSEQVRTITMH